MRKKDLEKAYKLLSDKVSFFEETAQYFETAFYKELAINSQLYSNNAKIIEEFKASAKDCEEFRKLSAQLTSDNLHLNKLLKEKNDRIDVLKAVIEAQKADLKRLQPKYSYIIRVTTITGLYKIYIAEASSLDEAKEKVIRDFDLSREKIIKIDAFRIN